MTVLARCGPRGRMMVVGGSVVVIIASLFWISARLKGKGDPSQHTEVYYLQCVACGEMYKTKMALADKPPWVCEKCGERGAYFAMKCEDCGEIFAFALPVDEDGNPILQNPACPKCESYDYSRYNPKKK